MIEITEQEWRNIRDAIGQLSMLTIQNPPISDPNIVEYVGNAKALLEGVANAVFVRNGLSRMMRANRSAYDEGPAT